MLASEVISKFGLYVDDMTELSTQEELDLLLKIVSQIYNDRPWEFLKKEWSTTTNGTAYIALPTDFKFLLENTDNTDSWGKSVFINGENYPLINWAERRQYAGKTGYCYIDFKNSRLYFTDTTPPTSGLSLSADYLISAPTAILVTTNLDTIFPHDFQDMLYHGMAIDDMIIQLFDKARSYASENKAKYDGYLKSMAYWNSNLINF